MIFNPVIVKTGGKAVDTVVLKDETGNGIGLIAPDGEDLRPDAGVPGHDGKYEYLGGALWLDWLTIDEEITGLGISVTIEIKENKLFVTFTKEEPPSGK